MDETLLWLLAGAATAWVGMWLNHVRQLRKIRRQATPLSEWLSAYPAGDSSRPTMQAQLDSAFREEVLEALFAELNQRDRTQRTVWVMSEQWWHDIRRIAPLHWASFMVELPDYADDPWLIGIPVKIRDDAGFPKLVPEDALSESA